MKKKKGGKKKRIQVIFRWNKKEKSGPVENNGLRESEDKNSFSWKIAKMRKDLSI